MPAATPAAVSAPPRATAIDALRGLAILGMVLVAVEPLRVLPAWMYHAQNPPPSHATDVNLAGLTWPDIVFPIFIFTLGAAIPLAIAPRLARGIGHAAIVRGALWRGALLVFFALFRQHFDSSVSGLAPEWYAWAVALAGFVVLCAVFARLPEAWGRPLTLAIRVAGAAAAGAMFALVRFPDGSHFRPERIDIILLLLAYCALFGTLVWLVTRTSVLARLAVLAAIASLRIVGYNEGWVSVLYAYDPVPWLYKFAFFQFLCAVIPGTIAGDMLLSWMRARQAEVEGIRGAWSRGRCVAIAVLAAASVPIVLAGVQGRYVFLTTVVIALLGAVAIRLVRRPLTSTESLIAQLVRWATFWLLLGLLLDPFDVGTRKVPETFAWFFQGCGLALFLLVVLLFITDVWRRPRTLGLLVDNGQNPMVAYVGYGMLLLPILGLTGIQEAIESRQPGVAVAFGWSVVLLLAVAFLVRGFTRLKLFWRT